MSLTPTEPDTIMDALAARIATIVPTVLPAHRFRRVDGEAEDLSGAEIRVYTLTGPPERIDPDGLWGSGTVGFIFDCHMRVAYGGLSDSAAARLAGRDAADVFDHPTKGIKRAPGQVAGIYTPVSGSFFLPATRRIDTDRGAAVYETVFEIHYLAAKNQG